MSFTISLPQSKLCCEYNNRHVRIENLQKHERSNGLSLHIFTCTKDVPNESKVCRKAEENNDMESSRKTTENMQRYLYLIHAII